MDIIKTTALITINETLWVQMIGFLIFLFLINRVMFRPVRRNMAHREAHFDSLRQDIGKLQHDMSRLSSQTEADEAQLLSEARSVVETLREESRHEAKRLMGKALEDIKVLRQEAEKSLKTSLASARQQVGPESEELTASIIHRMMNRGFSK